MKKLIVILIIVGLLGVAIVPRVIENMKEAESTVEQAVVTVGGEAVGKGDVATYYELIGNTYAQKTVPVLPPVPAEVKEIRVDVGDLVSEGDVLFVLDGESVESQVTQAQLGVEQANVGVKNAQTAAASARAAYEMAKSNYEINLEQYNFAVENLEKYEILYQESMVSEAEIKQLRMQANPETLNLLEQQLEQARQGMMQAQLGVEQASVSTKQANDSLETVQDTYNDLVVTAPVSGYITAQNLTVDVMAGSASPAMVIAELDSIKVTASVTANQVSRLKLGETVEVNISAIHQTFEGKVTSVNPSADSMTMLYPIVVTVDNPDIIIKPGMFATVRFVKEEAYGVLRVPTEAVVVRNDQHVVFVYDNESSVMSKEVATGVDNGYYVEIIEGVEEGDVVITDGVGLIDNDTRIKVIRGDE